MKRTAVLIAAFMLLSGCSASAEIAYRPALPSLNEAHDSAFFNECTVFLGSSVEICGDGAWLDEGFISITESGVYTLTGSLEGGCILIDCGEPVKLILDGADIYSAEGAAISCLSGELIIECAENTVNSLAAQGSGGAAVYSAGNLEICGGGAVAIEGARGVEAGGTLKITCPGVNVSCEGEPFTAKKVEKAESAEIITDR